MHLGTQARIANPGVIFRNVLSHGDRLTETLVGCLILTLSIVYGAFHAVCQVLQVSFADDADLVDTLKDDLERLQQQAKLKNLGKQSPKVNLGEHCCTGPKHLPGVNKLHAYMFAPTNDMSQADVESNEGFIGSLKQTVDKVQSLDQAFGLPIGFAAGAAARQTSCKRCNWMA